MHRKITVFCLIWALAVNSLLVAGGNFVLCLHEHDFGHLVTSVHYEDGDDCHCDETTPKRDNPHSDATDNGYYLIEAPHCFDIVMESSDEPVQRIAGSVPVKQPTAYSISYDHSDPSQKLIRRVEMRLVSRAPPAGGGALEQCVRKTVLRI